MPDTHLCHSTVTPCTWPPHTTHDAPPTHAPPLGDTMRIRTVVAALAAAALLTLTACESTDNNSPTKPDTATQGTSDQP